MTPPRRAKLPESPARTASTPVNSARTTATRAYNRADWRLGFGMSFGSSSEGTGSFAITASFRANVVPARGGADDRDALDLDPIGVHGRLVRPRRSKTAGRPFPRPA